MALPGIDLLDLDRFQRLEHHEMFKRLRGEDPVSWHEHPLGRGFWNVVSHADLVAINRDTATYSSEMGGVSLLDPGELGEAGGMDPRGVMMLYMDPPKHTRYRLLVNKGFTPRMIGIDDPEYSKNNDGDDGMNASMELYMYVNELAKKRKTDPRDDIVTKLINAELEGDRLSELEFDMFMLLLTVAGNETTRNTTAWGMWALMENPQQYKELANNLDGMLDRAIEEILRWATPVYHFRRTATVDTEFRGKEIKQGDKVVIWHTSADRDEAVFDDPFTFDITRWPNEHIAFGGGGAHFCLGANLARMELRLIFREVLERIPDMTMTGEPSMLRSNFIGGVKHLPVKYTAGKKRNPAPVS